MADTLDRGQFAEYVSYARNECHPTLTDAAVEKLTDCYVNVRTPPPPVES